MKSKTQRRRRVLTEGVHEAKQEAFLTREEDAGVERAFEKVKPLMHAERSPVTGGMRRNKYWRVLENEKNCLNDDNW